MKRIIDSRNIQQVLSDINEPLTTTLVEMSPNPAGVALVSPPKIAKSSLQDTLDFTEAHSKTNDLIYANTRNKLDIIGRQMKHLEQLMMDTLTETIQTRQLHNVACNFIKRPGHVYHLYERPSGQQYFGMLAPDEWTSPHKYLGSFRLEADESWSPAEQTQQDRNEGVLYLMGKLKRPTQQEIS